MQQDNNGSINIKPAAESTATDTNVHDFGPQDRVLVADRGRFFHRPRGAATILAHCGTELPSGEAVTPEAAIKDGMEPCPRCRFRPQVAADGGEQPDGEGGDGGGGR